MASTTEVKAVIDQVWTILVDAYAIRLDKKDLQEYLRLDLIEFAPTAESLLDGANSIRWTRAELLDYLNAGQVEIAASAPSSSATTATKLLQAGAKQAIPVDAIEIIEFVRNMGLDGSTPGAAIREVDREVMDAYVPGWSAFTSDAEVLHAMYDKGKDNRVFYVYPPQPATAGYIEMVYAKLPDTVANENVGTKITINDNYLNALVEFMLYRAFGKYAEAEGRSQNHYQAFLNSLQIKVVVPGLIN